MTQLKPRISTYRFPETYQAGNWMMFNIYVHEESNFNNGEAEQTDPAFNYSTIPNEDDVQERENIDNANSRGIQWFLENARQTRHLKIDTVLGIYLPANISFDYNVNWGSEDLGTLRSIMNAAGEGRQAAINALDDSKKEAFSISDIGKFSGDAGFIAMRKAAASLGHLVGIPLENAFDKHQKKTMNNHTELHFSGVNLRTFTFSFKFYPKTVQEARQIDSIIKVFKFHMYPELASENIGTYMLYPAEFEIQFMRGWDINGTVASSRNKNVAKIARCALTNCKVRHGDDEYVPIKGPNFDTDKDDWYNSFTQMDLSFTELTQLTKKDIVDGY